MASKSLDADRYERALAWLAIALLLVAFVAVLKGRAEWHTIGPAIWFHLATLSVALGLTPVMLLRQRGDALHRRLGWVWAIAMFTTALISLNIRMIAKGHFSIIHLLSALVIVSVPLLVVRARSHRVTEHRRSVRALVTGGILVAGFFTFPFGRLLGHWLFS